MYKIDREGKIFNWEFFFQKSLKEEIFIYFSQQFTEMQNSF